MPEATPVTLKIAEIEARQDEVLRQLDELNLQLERAISEWMKKNSNPAPQKVAA